MATICIDLPHLVVMFHCRSNQVHLPINCVAQLIKLQRVFRQMFLEDCRISEPHLLEFVMIFEFGPLRPPSSASLSASYPVFLKLLVVGRDISPPLAPDCCLGTSLRGYRRARRTSLTTRLRSGPHRAVLNKHASIDGSICQLLQRSVYLRGRCRKGCK